MSESLLRKLKIRVPVNWKRKWLFHILLIVLWAFFQYFLGSKVLELFIAVYFIIVIITSRRPTLLLLAIPVMVLIIFYTPVPEALKNLGNSNLQAANSPGQSLKNIFNPKSGLEVLPRQVQQMLTLIQNNQLDNYQLSDQLKSDPLITQRITESAWPIKMDNTSPYYFSLREEENDYSTCLLIDQRQDVDLVYCH